jgi:hypothetical protein
MSPITKQNPRPLIWDDTPAHNLLDKALYLVGLRTRGIATGYNFDLAPRTSRRRLAAGGIGLNELQVTSHWTMEESMRIIWRSSRIAIRRESGAMLARAGEVLDGYYFRSSDLNSTIPRILLPPRPIDYYRLPQLPFPSNPSIPLFLIVAI